MKQTLYQNPTTDQYDEGPRPSVAAKEEHLGQIGHDESITSPRAGSKEATIKLWVTWSEHRRSRQRRGEHVPKVKSVLSGTSRDRCRAGLLGTARG